MKKLQLLFRYLELKDGLNAFLIWLQKALQLVVLNFFAHNLLNQMEIMFHLQKITEAEKIDLIYLTKISKGNYHSKRLISKKILSNRSSSIMILFDQTFLSPKYSDCCFG